MRRWWVCIGLGLVVAVATFGVASGNVRAEPSTHVQNWSEGVSVVAQAEVSRLPSNVNTCSATTRFIIVEGLGEISACVFGSFGSTRLARYYADDGFTYAVALHDDIRYVRVEGVCKGQAWCVYSAGVDTLFAHIPAGRGVYSHGRIQNFSEYLVRQTEPYLHYEFAYDGEAHFIESESGPLETRSIALSSNGKWAIIELVEYGFVRMDIKTGQVGRVIASGGVYGHGFNPSFEPAISNDGRYVAIVGNNAGARIYFVDGECGDITGESSGSQFLSGSAICKSVPIDWPSLFPGFHSGYAPRFSVDGRALTLYIATSGNVFVATVAPKSVNKSDAQLLYVALGDSFVSGEGETDDEFYQAGTNTTANRCHVSLRSYPYLLYQSLPMDAYNGACSGARSEEVARQSLGLLETMNSHKLAFISVGVGGNDIDVMGKLKTCLGFGTCEWVAPENRAKTAKEIQAQYEKLGALFSDIQQAHPQATLFVVGYPEVINDTDSAKCGLPLAPLLNETERHYMNEVIRYLNQVLRSAAGQAGVTFIDISGAYGDERLCDATPNAMNGIRLGDDFSPVEAFESMKIIGAESFHPTPRGHVLAAKAIRQALDDWLGGVVCSSCETTPIAPPEYWGSATTLMVSARFIANSFLDTNHLAPNQTVSFSFPPGSFMPGEDVRIELHSDPVTLATVKADNSGAVSGTVTLPDTTGYHTVHALGKIFSGEKVDRYEVVFISSVEGNNKHQIVPTLGGSSHETPRSVAVGRNSSISGSSDRVRGALSTHHNTPHGAEVRGVAKGGATLARPSPQSDGISGSHFVWLGLIIAALVIGVIGYQINRREV